MLDVQNLDFEQYFLQDWGYLIFHYWYDILWSLLSSCAIRYGEPVTAPFVNPQSYNMEWNMSQCYCQVVECHGAACAVFSKKSCCLQKTKYVLCVRLNHVQLPKKETKYAHFCSKSCATRSAWRGKEHDETEGRPHLSFIVSCVPFFLGMLGVMLRVLD